MDPIPSSITLLDTAEKFEHHLSELNLEAHSIQNVRKSKGEEVDGKDCLVCALKGLGDFGKHLKRNVHQRNITLKKLKDIRDSMKNEQTFALWKSALDLLSTRRGNVLLLHLSGRNWNNTYNAGNELRGDGVADGSKKWCQKFLEDMEQLCVRYIIGEEASAGAKGAVYFSCDTLCMAYSYSAQACCPQPSFPKPIAEAGIDFPIGIEAYYDVEGGEGGRSGRAGTHTPTAHNTEICRIICRIIMVIHELRLGQQAAPALPTRRPDSGDEVLPALAACRQDHFCLGAHPID